MVASEDENAAGQAAVPACSAAAATLLRVLRRRVPGLCASSLLSCAVLDDEWLQLSTVDVLILDWCPTATGTPGADKASGVAAGASSGGKGAAVAEEQAVAAARQRLGEAGLLELLWQRFWAGCLLVGIGQACALLGQAPRGSQGHSPAPPVLPWYVVRAGGGTHGWAALHRALQSQPHLRGSTGLVGVGVLAGGCWLANPVSGIAEMLAAPGREALVAAAEWAALPGNDLGSAGLQEADDSDFGYCCELCPC
jgi:hypothetical protein